MTTDTLTPINYGNQPRGYGVCFPAPGLIVLVTALSVLLSSPGAAQVSISDTIALPSASGASLTEVRITGPDSSTAVEPPEGLLSKRAGILNSGLVARDRDTIIRDMARRGWWNAHVTALVDTLPTGTLRLSFVVDPGNPAITGRITSIVEEQDITPPAISDSVRNRQFSSDLLESLIAGITHEAARAGFPAATVSPILTARGDTVDVRLMVLTGRRAVIDSFIVTGLTRTRDSVVLRELDRLKGSPIGPSTIPEVRERIATLGFVLPADEPLIRYPDSTTARIVVPLVEGSQGSFDGVLGYQPKADGGGELVGAIDLVFPNIRGTGRSGGIRWENLGASSEDLELGYREPWIAGHPWTASGAFLQEERGRLGFTRTSMEASLEHPFGSITASGGYRYEKTSADSLSSTSAHGVTMGVVWQAITAPAAPTGGFRYALRWSLGAKRYRFGAAPTHRLERIEIDLDHYHSLFARQVAGILIRYRKVDPHGGAPVSADLYWLGGTAGIRGYREQSLPAGQALWATAEYRFLQGRASWVFLFVDSGYLVHYTRTPGGSTDQTTRNYTGYGFGLRLESRAGWLGFDYGIGEGDGIGGGKLHVRLTNSF